jgi:hypothetical protein
MGLLWTAFEGSRHGSRRTADLEVIGRELSIGPGNDAGHSNFSDMCRFASLQQTAQMLNCFETLRGAEYAPLLAVGMGPGLEDQGSEQFWMLNAACRAQAEATPKVTAGGQCEISVNSCDAGW